MHLHTLRRHKAIHKWYKLELTHKFGVKPADLTTTYNPPTIDYIKRRVTKAPVFASMSSS